MFYSQCILFKEGPLGAIWVAAYFFKKLKKAQVKETDIPSSVDEILQKDLDAVAYRVLAYLLLGLVRIFSKKVDFLLNDCNKVLIGLNDFVIKEKNTAPKQIFHAPTFCIALPKRFELDAFDLEILDDFQWRNVRPQEDITLKDGGWKNERLGQYSMDKFDMEEFANFHETSSADHDRIEGVSSSHEMDVDTDIACGNKEQDENTNIETLCVVDDEPLDPNKSYGDLQNVDEQMEASESDRLLEEASTERIRHDGFYLEECITPEKIYRVQREPSSNLQTDGEEINFSDKAETVNEMCQVIEDPSNLLESAENPRENSEGERMDFEMFHGSGKATFGVAEPDQEQQHTDLEEASFHDRKLSSAEKCQVNAEETPVLVTPEVPPRLKTPESSGGTTSQLTVVPTPAAKEGARISRKRKCLIDDQVIIPNSFMKRCIEDSSELITKRRKVPHTPLVAWRIRCLSSLSRCFLEPLIAYSSLELRLLFVQKKSKVSKLVEPPRKPEMAETSKAAEICEQTEIAPEMPKSAHTFEQTEIAPETPVRESKSIRFLKTPEGSANKEVRPENSFESFNEEPSPPSKDQDLDMSLMHEVSTNGGGDPQLDGGSGRTRMVARYLEKTFQNRRKRGDEKIVNLWGLCGGRTRKESARLFYEILVLKTKGYVDVKQDGAYGDILVLQVAG